MLKEGQATAAVKNVKVRQNEMSTPARPIISIGPDNTNFPVTLMVGTDGFVTGD